MNIQPEIASLLPFFSSSRHIYSTDSDASLSCFLSLSRKKFPPVPWFVKRLPISLKFIRQYKECWKYGKFPREIDLEGSRRRARRGLDLDLGF